MATPSFEGFENIARLALGAIASWSNVELAQLHVFVALMGGHQTLSASIFSVLKSIKWEAVGVAAAARFGEKSEELNVYRALKRHSESLESERNKLAHWVWGRCAEYPEHLMLVDPKEITLKGKHHPDVALAYSASDFETLIARNATLRELWSQFAQLIHVDDANQKRGLLLQKLLAAPEIQASLTRLAQGK